MVETQIIKENEKDIAVILDIERYKELIEFEQEQKDYYSAINTKRENTEWTSHEDLKKELGL